MSISCWCGGTSHPYAHEGFYDTIDPLLGRYRHRTRGLGIGGPCIIHFLLARVLNQGDTLDDSVVEAVAFSSPEIGCSGSKDENEDVDSALIFSQRADDAEIPQSGLGISCPSTSVEIFDSQSEEACPYNKQDGGPAPWFAAGNLLLVVCCRVSLQGVFADCQRSRLLVEGRKSKVNVMSISIGNTFQGKRGKATAEPSMFVPRCSV
ncbi:hypothetical protein V6N11_038826 [Hibiscus sabdariffa]|uniref:Uncharacterized protein n=1 Tax=Hibiscus sabdariffa TaxID=183260 RepID=A0ABR2SLY3_9ROSI